MSNAPAVELRSHTPLGKPFLSAISSAFRKVQRNVQDVGWLATIKKAVELVIHPVYRRLTYRIYVIDLPLSRGTPDAAPDRLVFSMLQPGDVKSVRQIEEQAEWLRGVIKRKLQSGSLCVVALDGDRVAGFNLVSFGNVWIRALQLTRYFRAGHAWSDDIFVRKEYRKQKLAVRIRHKVCHELGLRGVRKFYGGTLPSNRPSLRLAEKVGFRQIADVDYRKLLGRRTWRFRRVIACERLTR